MELTGKVIDYGDVIRAPSAAHPGLVPQTSGEGETPFHRGNRLFVPTRWRDLNAVPPQPVLLPAAGLLVIDTEQDRVISLLQDDRLADTIYSVKADSGDFYLFTGAQGVAVHQVLGSARPGGVLRVKNGEETFDPSYYLNLNDLVGGRPATRPIYAGGTSVYLLVYYAEKGERTPNPFELIAQEA